MTEPRVSVVVPVYNGAAYIGATLDALLAQSHASFEVLCIDDNSTDGSRAILDRYSVDDTRVRVLSTPSNLGSAPRVLNYSLPMVRGDYFAYSSQDDLFSPDWLEKLHTRGLELDADAVLPDVVFLRESVEASTRLSGLRGDRTVVLSNVEAVKLSLDWTIPGFALWRTALVKRLGFATFSINADEYSVREFFYNSNRIGFCDGVFYYNQNNPDAITKRLSLATFDIPFTHLRLHEFLRANAFDADACLGEYHRAVSSLLWARQRLEMSKEHLDASVRDAATRRMREAYDRINEPQFASQLARLPGIRGRLKAFSVSHGYSVFNAASVALATVRQSVTRYRALRR